jgi:hypothetical protein
MMRTNQPEEKMSDTTTTHWTQKLRARWGLESVFQVLMVLLVFSLTGMSVVLVKEPFFQLIGLTEETSTFWKWTIYILAIFPIYQVLLLFYALLLGQFSFFWAYEKKTIGRLARLFSRKS